MLKYTCARKTAFSHQTNAFYAQIWGLGLERNKVKFYLLGGRPQGSASSFLLSLREFLWQSGFDLLSLWDFQSASVADSFVCCKYILLFIFNDKNVVFKILVYCRCCGSNLEY